MEIHVKKIFMVNSRNYVIMRSNINNKHQIPMTTEQLGYDKTSIASIFALMLSHPPIASMNINEFSLSVPIVVKPIGGVSVHVFF